MFTYQQLRLALSTLVLISITGLIYRWHSTNESPLLPLQSATQDQQHQKSVFQPASYDRNDPRIAKLLENIDFKYCGGPCRFMLPVFIMEQGKIYTHYTKEHMNNIYGNKINQLIIMIVNNRKQSTNAFQTTCVHGRNAQPHHCTP